MRLDLLLTFAEASPTIAAYEKIAKRENVRIATDAAAPDDRLFIADDFRLMLVDRKLARLHVTGLFLEDDRDDAIEDEARALGIEIVSTAKALAKSYRRTLKRLEKRLGEPNETGEWTSEIFVGVDDEDEELTESHQFAYAAWELDKTLLVLLMNEEGDAHIGESATVDLRIAPRRVRKKLPDAIVEPFAWPVEH